MIERIRLQALVTPWLPLGVTGVTTLALLAWFGSDNSGVMTSRLRLAGIAVAATAAFFFDDPAAVTMAPSPARLGLRRWHRFVCLAAGVVAWWVAVSVLLRARYDIAVDGRLTWEMLTPAAVAVASALAVARWSGTDTPGMVGATVAPAWVALSHVPRPEWLVLPPTPGDDVSAFISVTIAVGALGILASRDPCTRIHIRGHRRSPGFMGTRPPATSDESSYCDCQAGAGELEADERQER